MDKITDDSARARKLLDIYGGEVDDFFKIWPADKTYFFSSDNKAFIAYGVKFRVAVCMGDPVGARKSISILMQEFKLFCKQRHLVITLIQTTDKYKEEYLSITLKSVLIGADAVIDLNEFQTTTIRNKYFRNLLNRYNKQAFTYHSYLAPHHNKLISELREVSDSWVDLPHRKEWSFLTGRFDDDYLKHVTLYVLRDKDGKAQAFANGLPSFKPGVATIDLMRHRADAPTNSIDLLFINMLKADSNEGYSDFNLGLSPLDARPFMHSTAERLLISLYKVSNSFIGFRGLHQFKSKYQPNWEPRYVWYQTGPGNLIKIGIAVLGLLRG
jgi:phosphatidylglycerol lysyltransferase